MTSEEIIEKCSGIPSDVHEEEQRMWYEYLKDLPGNPVIVDFGTGHGKSAATLALSCPQGMVYTFDPGSPYINVNQTTEQYIEATNKYIFDTGARNFIFTRESSLEKEWDREIDVLNIDSDHTYEGTKAEILKWLPFVKVGGLVFFHDFHHPRCPGVHLAIEELIPLKFLMKLLKVTDSGAVKCACFQKE